MLETTPTVREHGVAIGHDARHNSLRYCFGVVVILCWLFRPVTHLTLASFVWNKHKAFRALPVNSSLVF